MSPFQSPLRLHLCRTSFAATDLNDGSARLAGIRERGKEITVVPVVVGLYGANAPGKSNVLAASRLMRATALRSLSVVLRT
jgi:hypothetical protein